MTRTRPPLSVAILAAAAVLLAAGASAAEESAELQASARVYDTYCAQCHGVNRNGKGVNTVALAVQPRDHSDPKGMASLPREEMRGAIHDGGASVNKSSLMPAWSSVLTDQQIDQMIEYLHSVCHCGGAN